MTDILMGLRVQDLTQHAVTNATVTWVPTMSIPVPSGLLIPAPKTITLGATGNTLVEGIEPCDGTNGWSWAVTSTEDGVIRDQRSVLVPDAATVDFKTLVQVRPTDLHSLTADEMWVGLESDPPPPNFRGWWLVSAPGNPALGIETGSGDLRRVL